MVFFSRIPGVRCSCAGSRSIVRALLVTTGLLWLTPVARAGPPFVVDDPGTVEQSKGTLLLRYELVRAQSQSTQSLPAATLTLGLPARLELAFDAGFLLPQGDDTPSGGSATQPSASSGGFWSRMTRCQRWPRPTRSRFPPGVTACPLTRRSIRPV